MSRKKSIPVKTPATRPLKFNGHRKNTFLKVFAECNSVKKAASLCGISAKTVYEHLKNDEEFAKKFEETNREIEDALEAEAYRRAVTGVKTPVYYKGECIGYELKYSDRLLEMLLAGRSDRYKKKSQVEVSGNVEHTVSVENAKDKLMKKLLNKGIVIEGESQEVDSEDDDN